MRDYQYIGYKLNNSTEVTQYVSNRIYHGMIPETVSTLPAINYIFISRPNIGYGVAERPRYQISVRSDDPGEAMNVAHEVHSVFNNAQESLNGFDVQKVWYEESRMIIEPTGIYHIPVDLFLMYVNTT